MMLKYYAKLINSKFFKNMEKSKIYQKYFINLRRFLHANRKSQLTPPNNNEEIYKKKSAL